MKNPLAGLPWSFYLWFLTPILTFLVFLTSPGLDLGPGSALLATPIVGCIGLSVWLSRSSRFTDIVFLLVAQFCRAFYIFVIGFLYLYVSGAMSARGDIVGALGGVSLFCLISFFFYMIPDIAIVGSTGIIRKFFAKLSPNVVAVAAALIGVLVYYVSFRILVSQFV